MFSVVIPVYNGEKFIDKAIESVFAQTVTDWELIVINDGSCDSTAKCLDKYGENNKIHIINQDNRGVSVARNRGIRAASGSHIGFLDADDVWEVNHLEVMQKLIEKYPDAGLYGSFTKVNLANGGVIEECNYFRNREETVYLSDFFEAYHSDKSAKMFTVITTCVSKEAVEKIGGFPPGCRIGEDLEMSLKVAAYYPVVLTKRITAVYEKGNSTATKDVSFDPDWGFFDTVQSLYSDETIPVSKRINIKRVMDWFTIRRCRHYIIDGRKRLAWRHFFEVSDSSLRKEKLITFVLLLLPCRLVNKMFAIRWRGKA